MNNVETTKSSLDDKPASPVTPELVSGPPTPPLIAISSLSPSPVISSAQRSPYHQTTSREGRGSKTWTPTWLMSPTISTTKGTPVRRVLVNLRGYLEEVGHLTKLNPQDAWLPITESQNGNAHYAAFHSLNAGIGFQALVLPVAFVFLGWTYGIMALTIAYLWQLYTLWLLVKLHEAIPGKRYNRYIELAQAAFGERLGFWLTLFPTMYLSAGIATILIIFGGQTMKLFFQIVCGSHCSTNPLSTIEWYLVFTCLSIILSQLPNLNSIAGLSLIGAVMAMTYTTITWVLSVSRERPHSISYQPLASSSLSAAIFSTSNALGIIAFSFRGHNITLEIQATMPSTLKHPANVPMWRGVKVAYVLIALCLFPVAIGGFWAYGNNMPAGGMLIALYAFHSKDTNRSLLAMIYLLAAFHCLSSFQIYSMPVFDSMEAGYTSKHNKPCPIWVRAGFRVFYGFFSFFIGVAFPFLSSLAGLMGGLTLPVAFAYPCFMYIFIEKPKKCTFIWYLNWTLSILGIIFSLAFSAGGIWSVVTNGLKLEFFKP